LSTATDPDAMMPEGALPPGEMPEEDPDVADARRQAPEGGVIQRFTSSLGGTIRYAVWRLPRERCRGTVLLLTGYGEFIEKYYETISDLTDRGFTVCIMDWRGHGLSSRDLMHHTKGHVRSFDHYVEDLKKFVRTIVKEAGPLPRVILAHSMGAHLALRFLHDHRGEFDRAVLCAPMVDLRLSPMPRWLLRLLVRLYCTFGLSTRFAWPVKDYGARARRFPGNRLTSDPARFRDMLYWIERNPDLAIGPPTFGWLRAAFESMTLISDPAYARAIDTPILIISASDDRVVNNAAQERLVKLLSSASLVSIKGARHEVLKERTAIRNLLFDQFDRFVG
jgi:lysophospholipase